MKNILVLLLFISGSAYSQDLLDTIATATCNCIKEIKVESVKKEDLNIKLGSCLIKIAMPYKQQLKANNDINMDELNEETGRRLGVLISGRMLTICPETLAGIGTKSKGSPVSEKTGRIQEIQENEFVTLSIVDEERMISKFIWLKNFPGSDDLASLKKPKGKKVIIEYIVNEYYDARIKDYRNYNVINSLRFGEEKE